MPYPSTLSSFTDPLPTNRLNSPSHSSIETAQNTGLEEIQTFVGTLSSNVGTLVYDIRATASDGGGHVQGVNKGGTGQTSYTKGDMLVATSSSVIAKLGVGTDNQILVADSSVAAGIKWTNNTTPKVATSASIVSIAEGAEASVVSVTVPGSTLGTSNAVRVTVPIQRWSAPGQNSIIAIAQYGGANVASVAMLSRGASIFGEFRYTIIANNSATAQRAFLNLDFSAQDANFPTQNTVFDFGTIATTPSVAVAIRNQVTGTASVNSSANQTIGLVVRLIGSNGSMDTGGYIIEKIA